MVIHEENVETVTIFQNLTPRCPLNPLLLRSHVWLYPRVIFIQVRWKYIKVCGYGDPFSKSLNQRSLIPTWPLTPSLLRSHVWLYPRIIVSKSHGNTSMYVDRPTVINFEKYHIHLRTYYVHTHGRAYYVQNEWSHTSLSELSSGKTKRGLFCEILFKTADIRLSSSQSTD